MIWQRKEQFKNGEYIIDKILGSGGFGNTYRAYHKDNHDFVAIKTPNEIMQVREDFFKHQERFVKEAFYLQKFDHPNIVSVKDIFYEDGLWCMVMEYVEGLNLKQYVDKYGILSIKQALLYIQQIGNALIYVHEKGFLHRDVKPGNIILNQNSNKVILIDFGLAREFIQNEFMTHTNAITNGFAPLEQYKKKAIRGAYTDVYALAATLYFLLTKEVPCPAHLRKKHQISLSPPKKYNSQISDSLNDVILQGLELLPQDRPQTMKKWLGLLEKSTINVVSEVDLDYRKLEYLLKQNNWQEADQETRKVMLEAGKQNEIENIELLLVRDIENFPCLDLLTIDRLWKFYSQGHFGFSIQKEIYQGMGGSYKYNQGMWNAFGDKVGWRIHGNWLSQGQFFYSQDACKGHLPSLIVPGMEMLYLFHRLEVCH